MKTIHMIGNAHLDPVWLWRWPVGLVETISTARTVVNLLDRYPEFVFTRSDVWFYQQIERYDPDTFFRIQGFVENGRWQLVGGMYIQPDCNLPLEASFQKHLTVGDRYFRDRFGKRTNVGYNPDSFGHAGSLPSILSRNGFDSYVMMRPMQHEKSLPGPLFRWRSDDGAELVTWRIPRQYNSRNVEDLIQNVNAVLAEPLPDGIEDTMCFFGIGDHGGGPTAEQIEWIRANPDYFPGFHMEFSHPRRFFDAVLPHKLNLPIVEEELQFHAVGCYSVVRNMKQTLRRAEYRVMSAENSVSQFGEDAFLGKVSAEDLKLKLESAWERVLFNHFHDTLGGTSLPEAYADAQEQLGYALDQSLDILHQVTMSRLQKLPPDPLQRIVVFNFGPVDYSDYVEHEPWLEWTAFGGRLLSSDGEPVEYQVTRQPSLSGSNRMLLFPVDAPKSGHTILRLDHSKQPYNAKTENHGGSRKGAASGTGKNNRPLRVSRMNNSVSSGFWSVGPTETDSSHLISLAQNDGSGPIEMAINMYEDPSDTWSHFIPGYTWDHPVRFQSIETTVEETGPLRATLKLNGEAHDSYLTVWNRVYRDSDFVEIVVRLNWHEHLRVAKLELTFPDPIMHRYDGIPGGAIVRPQNRQEFPLVNHVRVETEPGESWGIIAPDVFGLDGWRDRIRFTLCRSPAYAWQGKKGGLERTASEHWTDQGIHLYKFRLYHRPSEEELSRRTANLCHGVLAFDWTRGMA